MRNRIRIDGITSWRVEDCARRENRDFPSALGVLVGDGYRVRQQTMPAPDASMPDLTDDAGAIGKAMSFHAKQTTIDALKRLSEIEERSLSNCINTILRAELRRKGLLKSRGNDPVIAADGRAA
jgi:hypothetical protein